MSEVLSKLAEHRLFIEALTAATAFLIGLIALRLGQRALREERWIGYFGWGFLIFGVQYAIPSCLGIAQRFGHSLDLGAWFSAGIPLLCSAANNVCFLAAGISLWRLQWAPSRRYWLWASGFALLSAAADGFELFAPWHRAADGLFSSLAAGALGISFFGNASAKRRRLALTVAYFGAFLYVLLSLSYAAIPRFTGEAADSYDVALIAVALVLKVFLALGGFSLILQALVIISPRQQQEILQDVSHGDLEYFSGAGVVRAIRESLAADRASVFIRLPGRPDRVLRWRSPEIPDDEIDLPPATDGREGQVLVTGVRVISQGLSNGASKAGSATKISRIVEPLVYHGTVTGCLSLEWNSPRGFTRTSLQQAARLVELLGPAVEARRVLAALLYWGEKRQESQIERRPPGYRGLAETLARLVFETLSPLAVGLELEVGFGPVWAAVGDVETVTGFRGGLPSDGLVSAVKKCGGGSRGREQTIELGFGGVKVGKLTLLWSEVGSERFTTTRPPAVHLDEQYLQVFVPLIVSAVLRSVETAFFQGLSDLQVLLLQAGSADEWFVAIDGEVRQRGPLWALANLPDGRVLGDPSLEKALRFAGIGTGEETLWNGRPEEPIHGAFTVVRLRLAKSRANLWLGASNPNLGPELSPGWPWHSFLERLAATGDASLYDLTKEAELHRYKKEVRRIEGLVRATVDNGTFIHEMRNIARNFRFAAQSLSEAKSRGKLSATIDIEQDIEAMIRSADRLSQLADSVLKPREVQSSGKNRIKDLFQEIEELFAPVLRAHFIEVRTEIVPQDLETSVPVYILITALKTLVSNSVDAIGYHGLIRIEAESTSSIVRVAVVDSGPGISLADPQTIFALGTSTKGTTGLGLFLVRNLLETASARIHLTNWQPGETTFVIELPIPLQGATYAADMGSDR